MLESCYLEDRALRLAGRVVASAGLDGATTSTGVGPEGATEHAVRVLREELPPSCMVKAAGGKQQETLLTWLEQRTNDPQAQVFARWIRRFGTEYVSLMKIMLAETGYGFRPTSCTINAC